jgi:octaprenyl-diphosphate synthase
LFGEKVGMAFQIKDDLFDYGDADIGKPRGIDIKERKMTLPLIYALNKATPSDKRWVINVFKNHNKDQKKVKDVLRYVKGSGGIEYAIEKMKEYRNEALALLHSYPTNDARLSLEQLIQFTIERQN